KSPNRMELAKKVLMSTPFRSNFRRGVRVGRLDAAVDAVDPLAVQAEHAVEAAQFHPVNVWTLVGQAGQDLRVEPDLVVELARDEPLEQANAAARAGPLRLGEAQG